MVKGGPETVEAPRGANTVSRWPGDCARCARESCWSGAVCGTCGHRWTDIEVLVGSRADWPAFVLSHEGSIRATEANIGHELARVVLRAPGASMERVTALQARLARLVAR
jgi:hypothetical protein